jgi:hypothetical protein
MTALKHVGSTIKCPVCHGDVLVPNLNKLTPAAVQVTEPGNPTPELNDGKAIPDLVEGAPSVQTKQEPGPSKVYVHNLYKIALFILMGCAIIMVTFALARFHREAKSIENEITPSKVQGSDILNQTGQLNTEPIFGDYWKIPDIGMEFIWIKALDCWVGKYEVTNQEYRRFKPKHDSKEHHGNSLNSDRQPVVYVNYDDAIEYSRWLTERERNLGRLPFGYHYRLPTKEEWTRFCQCGDNREYPWGNAMPPKYGNYSKGAPGSSGLDGYNDGFTVTCPVEKSGKNDWGLYGVGGNVSECTIKSSSDFSFDAWRGASWFFLNPVSLRSSCRIDIGASYHSNSYGFRLLLSNSNRSQIIENKSQIANTQKETNFAKNVEFLVKGHEPVIIALNEYGASINAMVDDDNSPKPLQERLEELKTQAEFRGDKILLAMVQMNSIMGLEEIIFRCRNQSSTYTQRMWCKDGKVYLISGTNSNSRKEDGFLVVPALILANVKLEE